MVCMGIQVFLLSYFLLGFGDESEPSTEQKQAIAAPPEHTCSRASSAGPSHH